MPRQLRIEYSGAIYHVMNRGDRREPIFQDDTDQSLRDYAWSSWPDYLKPPEQRPCWLRVDRMLGELQIAGHKPASVRMRHRTNVQVRQT